MENVGLMVLPNYPFCYYNNESLLKSFTDFESLYMGKCVVIGTIEKMEELFNNTPALDGCCLEIRSAPRIDLIDNIKKAGMTDCEGYSTIKRWYYENIEAIRVLIGNENQVAMNIEVK